MTKKDKEALVLKQETMPVQSTAGVGYVGGAVDSSDIKLPRLLLMQALSEFVVDGKAAVCDIVDNTTKEVVAKRDHAIEVIPVSFHKSLVTYRREGQNWAWVGQEAVSAANSGLSYFFEAEGVEHKRVYCLNFFLLLARDIPRGVAALQAKEAGERVDPDDMVFPYMVTFRNSSYNTGKDLTTFFAKAAFMNMSPSCKVWKLGAKTIRDDSRTYQVWTVEKLRWATDDELRCAQSWAGELATKNVVVSPDEDEVERGGQEAAAAPIPAADLPF